MRQLTAGLLGLVLGFSSVSFAHAANLAPDQVVQKIADDLANSIGAHREELKADRDRLIREIDAILLPHFDIEYASLLVLGDSVSFGVGVERIFPLHSPMIADITVLRRGRVRRAKLFYLRSLAGKATRIREKKVRVAVPETSTPES